MSKKETQETKGIIGWIDYRLPVFTFMKHQKEYRTPRNLSYLWSFGSIAGIALVIQIVTGFLLSMHYTPHVDMAFGSVEHIMRDVRGGWMLRYLHAVGASMFFIAVYLHILRGLYYGSYKAPREILWWIGIIIFLMMMATAFMGYVLPWGQMSFWGATVITNLFSAFDTIVDGLGTALVTLLWGGFSVDNPTLNRFYSLHFILPLVIVALVILHLVALHIHGSNNPTGVEPKTKKDTIPFDPYYTIKDFVGFGIFFIAFAYFVFFDPNMLGHPDNYIEANPLVTPEHIVPEWYFLPFYAMLRAVPDKLLGVLVMFASILILFVLPWLDTHKTKSGAYRPWFKWFYLIFAVNAVALGYLGSQPAEGSYVIWARICTLYYFGYFLVILPVLSKHEKSLPLPSSIYDAMQQKKHIWLVAALLAGAMFMPGMAQASGGGVEYKKVDWHFEGAAGTFDRAAIRRGFQVYQNVCASCHGLKRVAYRNLQDLGLSEDAVKAIAAEKEVEDGPDDAGDMFMRAALPSDRFVSPFPNEKAARAANGGAYPPDLSLMVKARADGANYLYSLLTGYEQAPAGFKLGDGMYYNEYFANHQIAMPPPLSDGLVEYEDGAEATVDQMAKDVVSFLQWAAEPEMESRKEMGWRVIFYLVIFTLLFYVAKKRVWARINEDT